MPSDTAATPLPPDPRCANFSALVEAAHRSNASGRAAEALDLANQAATLAAKLPAVDITVAWSLNLLGVVFFDNGYDRQALEAYGRAFPVAEASADLNLGASLHNNLGQAHGRLGDLQRAKGHLESAVDLRQKQGGESMSLAFSLDNLGAVLCQLGELDAAVTRLHRALGIFRRLRGVFDRHAATAFGNLANVHARRQDFEMAEACRLRALDSHQRSGRPCDPETLIDMASLVDIYWHQGERERADRLLTVLLSMGGTPPTAADRNVAEKLRNLLRVAAADHRLDVAERLAARVIALLETTEGPAAPETLEAVHHLANVYRAVGNHDAAESAFHRARIGYENHGMADKALAATIDLSKLYRDRNAFPVAERLLTTAADTLRARHGNAGLLASVIGNLATVHYETERYETADVLFGEALEALELEADRDENTRAWLLHGRAKLTYHLGNHATAAELYEAAKRLWSHLYGNDHPFVATAAANLALVHWAGSKVEGALSCFAEAEALRDREMQRILAVGSERKRAAYARDLQEDLYKVISFSLRAGGSCVNAARFAAQMLLRRKGRVLDAVAHSFSRLRERAEPQDRQIIDRLMAVRERIAALTSPLVVEGSDIDRHRLDSLRREEEQIEAALSYRGALHRPGLDPVSLDGVRSCLDAETILVDIIQFPEFDPVRTDQKNPWKDHRYAAMVTGTSGDPLLVDLGPAAQIDRVADAWRRLLRRDDSDVREIDTKGAELYGVLIAPWERALAGVRRILIAPDGKLLLIPFGLMRDSLGQSLDERFVVSYLSSGRELLALRDGASQAEGIVVVAAPAFSADLSGVSSDTPFDEEEREFPDLPGAIEEAAEIRRLFPTARLITGAEATAEEVRRLRRPLVLHVATHGIFREIKEERGTYRRDLLSLGGTLAWVESTSKAPLLNPMFSSGLALAGANHRGKGILTSQEMATIDLSGTALVVLSACETGLGAVRAGEEFAGLRRALAIAGAETQLTSLWRVNDAATRFLMTRYYERLAAGDGRAEALQRAARDVAAADTAWRHPAYWASFVSAGAWSPVVDRLAQAHAGRAPQ